MFERAITQSERDAALNAIWREQPVNTASEFGIGALIGIVVAGLGSFLLKYVILDLFFRFSPISVMAYYSIFVGVGLLGFGVFFVRSAYKNYECLLARNASIRADLESGLAHEWSGDVKSAHFDKKQNSEHPPIRIEFVAGDIVTLDLGDQSQFNIHQEPGSFCRVVRLPNSGITVHASAH